MGVKYRLLGGLCVGGVREYMNSFSLSRVVYHTDLARDSSRPLDTGASGRLNLGSAHICRILTLDTFAWYKRLLTIDPALK